MNCGVIFCHDLLKCHADILSSWFFMKHKPVKETQWLIVLVDIWLVKDNRYSEEKDSFLQSADMVVTHKISSSIAYLLLKILSQFIHLIYFPIKLSKRTGRQWVLGKKIFLFVLVCLIFWQWLFFFTTLWLALTLSLMHHNDNSYWYSITESPLQKPSLKLPSTLFLSA